MVAFPKFTISAMMIRLNMSNMTATKTSPHRLVLCQLFYPGLISTGQTVTDLCEELVDMAVGVEVVCGPPIIG